MLLFLERFVQCHKKLNIYYFDDIFSWLMTWLFVCINLNDIFRMYGSNLPVVVERGFLKVIGVYISHSHWL